MNYRDDPLDRDGEEARGEAADLARGESVMKYKSPLNVLKDTHDRSC